MSRLSEKLTIVGGITVLIGAFAVVGEVDYQEAKRMEAAREDRAASLAASYCLPRPGQEARWKWKGEGNDLRLHCEVYTNLGYARAPQLVLQAAPAGLDRLALFHGEDAK